MSLSFLFRCVEEVKYGTGSNMIVVLLWFYFLFPCFISVLPFSFVLCMVDNVVCIILPDIVYSLLPYSLLLSLVRGTGKSMIIVTSTSGALTSNVICTV